MILPIQQSLSKNLKSTGASVVEWVVGSEGKCAHRALHLFCCRSFYEIIVNEVFFCFFCLLLSCPFFLFCDIMTFTKLKSWTAPAAIWCSKPSQMVGLWPWVSHIRVVGFTCKLTSVCLKMCSSQKNDGNYQFFNASSCSLKFWIHDSLDKSCVLMDKQLNMYFDDWMISPRFLLALFGHQVSFHVTWTGSSSEPHPSERIWRKT